MTGRDFRSAWKVLKSNSATQEYDLVKTSAWWRCLSELLWAEQSPDDTVTRDLQFGPTSTPRLCAAASTAALMDALRDVPRGPQKAAVLIRLAQWWLTEFGDEVSPEWRADRDHYRQALRAIRGIGPETADRLILIAGELPVFPIDRGILRVVVRHGWLDLPVDDEQAQATFHSVLEGDAAMMQHAVRVLKTIGSRYCGRVPDCASCPLERFLPEGGPLHVDQC